MRSSVVLAAVMSSIATIGLGGFDVAFGAGLSNKTITYKSGGLTGGTFSVYIGTGGHVYESNLAGDPGAQGIKYTLGKTSEETTTLTDALGAKLTCSVRGTATMSEGSLHLKSVYHCNNGNFDHDVVIQIQGDTCSVQRSERNQGLPFGNSNNSSSCAVTSGNQLGPAKWLQ